MPVRSEALLSDRSDWLERLPEAVLVLQQGLVVYANQAARRLFDPAAGHDLVDESVARLLPGATDGESIPRAQRRDGSRFAMSLHSEPISLAGRPALLHIVRDIEHELALQQRLDSKRRTLLALSGRLIHVQEHERRHIARELHDEIGQCLSAIRVQFAKLQRRVESDEALDLIDSAASMTEQTLGRVRSLALLLHPPQLETLGLTAALRWHLEEQQRLHGLRIRFDADAIDEPVHPDLAIAIYRIVQEALSNALRHSEARQVTVKLGTADQVLQADIIDDGRGFNTDQSGSRTAVRPTLGLMSMAERARLLGGELTITSAPGKGTRVAARLPLQPLVDHDKAQRDPRG